MSGKRSDDAMLTAYLADRDVLCPNCEYNLRGVKANCCPECGRPFALLSALAWYSCAYLVGLCVLAGLIAIPIWNTAWMLQFAHHMGLTLQDIAETSRELALPNGVMLIAAIMLLSLWVAFRKVFMRQRHFIQWLLVGACLALYPAAFFIL